MKTKSLGSIRIDMKIMIVQILVILFVLISTLTNAQNRHFIEKDETSRYWIVKARIIPTPIGASSGIGLEKQLGSKISAQVLFNAIGYKAGADASSNTIISVIPELRYHFGEFSNRSLFINHFLEFGNHSKSLSGEIDLENYTHNEGGNFVSSGFLLGKNMRLKERLHLDFYVGPRFRWQNETIIETISAESNSTNKTVSKWGVRVGLNLNYTFKRKYFD